ncbi:MAG: PAS domain-containing protein, partial [Campylobacteraceae bacterium]|nr:PAS domain-containing protein [Campylobacteraceae bacterium]
MNTKQNFDLICDTVDNGIILLDQNLEVHFWNNWLETRTNIPFEQIRNKNLQDFFPNINKKTLDRKIKTALNLNSPTFYHSDINHYLLDIELNKVTNKVFNFMRQGVTITPYDTKLGMVIVYIYDTTLLSEVNHKLEKRNDHLKETQRILEEEINKIELLLDATMDAMFVFQQNLCVNTNSLGAELFGFKNKKEVLGKVIFDFLKNNSDLDLSQHYNKPFEVQLIKKDDTFFPALIKIKKIVFKESKFEIMTVVDLTELKSKDKLIAEQSKLAAMGEMIGNIAHQWRQPLNTISTAASGVKLLKECNALEDQDLEKSLEGIIKSAKYLSQTIDDFKDFLKGDKEKTKFNLKDNIKKDLSILEGMLKSSHIQVIEVHDASLELFSYNNELSQAIINILSNAKDAFSNATMDEKYIFITTYIKNSNAMIEIKDNAGGIPLSIINKIFEPYFTTKHKSLGTGLGLYMTQQIIKQWTSVAYQKDKEYVVEIIALVSHLQAITVAIIGYYLIKLRK